ncbi:MAG: head GIN domain-containing protein [Bacteroidota bacterium]
MKKLISLFKKNLVPALAMLTVLGFGSCLKHHWLDGNGHVVTQDRNTESFHALNASGDYEVYFNKDSLCSVTVEAEENLLPYIETEVWDGVMHVGTKNHVNIDDHFPIKVYLRGPYLDNVKLSGSGKIVCDSLITNNLSVNLSGSGHISLCAHCNDIHAEISGSGDLEMGGITNESNLHISGSGNIHSFNLQQNTCFAKISGSGNMYVTVSDLLDATISGSGKIYYQGNPTVNTHISGSGSVIHY